MNRQTNPSSNIPCVYKLRWSRLFFSFFSSSFTLCVCTHTHKKPLQNRVEKYITKNNENISKEYNFKMLRKELHNNNNQHQHDSIKKEKTNRKTKEWKLRKKESNWVARKIYIWINLNRIMFDRIRLVKYSRSLIRLQIQRVSVRQLQANT